MNFDPTDEQRRWRDLARDFAQGEIRPRAAELDREQKFPYDIIASMARLGLMGLTLPEEYGGSGGDFVAYNLALEEISRADTSVGITMEAHISGLRPHRRLRHTRTEGEVPLQVRDRREPMGFRPD